MAHQHHLQTNVICNLVIFVIGECPWTYFFGMSNFVYVTIYLSHKMATAITRIYGTLGHYVIFRVLRVSLQ